MRSAQRKNRLVTNAKRSHVFGLMLKVFIPLVVVLSIVLYLKLNTKFWNGTDKVAFVFQQASGDVGVTILDPALSEETTLIVPGDTQVDVARGYGTLRIKNVWQLGVNEHLGGGLLAQTVTESFLFPTTLWTSRALDNPVQFVFGPAESNIPFGDRLAIAFFALKVKSIDTTEIDLGKNQFLKKQTLTDGLPGFVVSGPISGRLTVYFADNVFAAKNLKFGLIDVTGSPGVADGVGAILEVLGGKVVSVDRRTPDDSVDCRVLGQNADAVRKIAVLFGCRVTTGASAMDMEMWMGGAFAKRF